MTQHDDLDRGLGEWMADGPGRTPEPVLGSAVQHARSHPRRPDPVGFLRPDAMRARTSLSSVAPVPVLAAIGLLLVAAIGVSLVGGRQGDPVPSLLPVPTDALDPGPSTRPSGSPNGGTMSPGPSFPLRVGLQTGIAASMVVDVTDDSGLLVDARSGPPSEGGSVPGGRVRVTAIDDRTVLLTWTDAACEIAYELRIEKTTAMTLVAPPCLGDAIALDRRLILQFAVPLDAAAVQVVVVQTGAAGG